MSHVRMIGMPTAGKIHLLIAMKSYAGKNCKKSFFNGNQMLFERK